MIDWLASLDPRVLMAVIGALALLIALPLEVAAFRRLRRVQLVSGTMYMLLGIVVVLAAGLGAITARARLAKDQGFQAVLGSTRGASPEPAVVELNAADLAQPETPGHLRANRVEDLLLWSGEDADTTRAVRECARVYARQRAAGATLQTLVDDGRLLAWCFVHPPSDGCARITHLAATPELRRGDGRQRFAARVARTAVAGGASRVLLAQD